MSEQRRGLVALGDSITRGRGGSPVLGVHFQSWAQWLAEALELPLTNLAADGGVTAGVLAEQVPRLRGPYDVGCLLVGVNDARGMHWDAQAFARDVAAIVGVLGEACDRVALLTLPEDLGRPTSAPKPAQANGVLRRIANDAGAVVVELAGFGGRRVMLPDVVHPTSVGQLTIADAAARALGAARMPSSLAESAPGRCAAARFEAWWWRQWLRDVVRRERERRAGA